MALIVKGEIRRVKLTTGEDLLPPARWSVLHDETGEQVPRDIVVVAPHTRVQSQWLPLTDSEHRALGKYYGKQHVGARVVVDIPQASWQRIGDVATFDYARRGKHEGNFSHSFGVRVPVLVSTPGAMLVLVLPAGCVFDERGFVDRA